MFNSSYPWVGFHGQLQGDKITALGLVLFNFESAKCRPYSDAFINQARQVFTVFDRDGNGLIDSSELDLLRNYLSTYGTSPDMRFTG